MKIWKATTGKRKYISYHGFIVVAETREDAMNFIKEKYGDSLADRWKNFICTYVGETSIYKEKVILMTDGLDG